MTNETPEAQGPYPGVPPLPTAEPVVGYCRACGMTLHPSTMRQAMGTLYCAQHMPAPPPHSGQANPGQPGSGQPGSGQPGSAPGPDYANPGAADSPYGSPYAVPPQPPVVNADANPGLAFMLGFIPGVGAIYNAQYAKGLMHVIVFGFFVSLAESSTPMSGLGGLLIPIWVFYMAFEAYHTAKLRRAGQPVDEFSAILPSGRRSSAFPAVPVFLIAAGVLFLLVNFEVVSFRYLFRLWPAALIVLGVYLLWDRVSGRPSAGGFGDVQ